MIGLFYSVKNLLSIPQTVTDNAIFRLHYRVTVALLLCGVMLGTSQLFGKYIECINNDDIPSDVMALFCWIQSTFSIPSAWNKTVGEEIPYPGVDKHVKGQDKVYHKYYQWVYIVLFIQAVFFYIPRYIWRLFEYKRIKKLVLGLNVPILTDEDEKDQKQKLLVEYLSSHLEHHKLYAGVYIICEILNLVNVVVQMYVMDSFLGGEFINFGTKVIEFTGAANQEFRQDPMVRVFPRMAKCTMHRFGPSGGVSRHDAFCILPLNIINEKIYIFLWFWFIILAILSTVAVIYRISAYFSLRVRQHMLRWKARLTDPKVLSTVVQNINYSDWFVLYLLCKNLDPIHFAEVMEGFAAKQMKVEGKREDLQPLIINR